MDKKFHIKVLGACAERIPTDLSCVPSIITHDVYDMEKMLDPFPEEPQVILCLSSEGQIPEFEIAQSLRMSYAETAIYYVAFNSLNFNKKLLIKNGFTDAFLLPWEHSELISAINTVVFYSLTPDLRNYIPIHVNDLKEGYSLNFSTKIHLSMNNKLVPFSAEDETLSSQKLEKLSQHHVTTLFIHKEDEQKFEKYATQESHGQRLSHTETTKRLSKFIRELIGEMLISNSSENTFEKSKALMNEIKKLVKTISVNKEKKLSQAISNLAGKETNFYNHLTNVCCYSLWFSMSLGMENADEIGMAGLLHDIGKMSQKDEEGDGQIEHHQHPQYTIDLIRAKRMIVTENSMKAILHHHEAMNGMGFPKALHMSRISPEGRVLAIADRFDELTRERRGQRLLNPLEAMELMLTENTGDPAKMILDTEMIRKILIDLRR